MFGLLAGPTLHATVPAGQTQRLDSPEKPPEGLASSDWSSIRAAYEAGRHAFAPTEGGWQARNPGQQWITRFDGRGFLATPQGGDWTWGLELRSYGTGEKQTPVGKQPPQVKAEGQRLSYDWDATVREWWINDPRGLEHGYIIAARPSTPALQNSTTPSPLTLTLATRGNLTPKIAADARGVVFNDTAGVAVVNYSGLKVWDADGKTLSSRFETAGEKQVRLVVDDSGARYPVTIDPIAQQAYLKAHNTEALQWFGSSVAVSGDTAIVGAFAEDSNATGVNGNGADNSMSGSGAAYVFVRNGTTWAQQAYLKASNTGAGDRFGSSVAVSGDTVVVGAEEEDSNATGINGNQANNTGYTSGAAYVFVRNGTTWTQEAYLKASNAGNFDRFGSSVAVSGDTVVVGAEFEDSNATGINGNGADNSLTSPGAVYVFARNGTRWTQQAYLKASNTGGGDQFGNSVAVSGDTVVVGAENERSNATGVNGDQANNSVNQAGAAYVFVRSGTTWSQQAYLKASNTGAGDFFGRSVAVSGDTVVVGALGEDSNATGVNSNGADNSATNSGAAYVFVRNGTNWMQQAYLKANNSDANDEFGGSVAVSGDTVVVGADFEYSRGADNSISSSGAAYVFVRNGTTWMQRAYLKANNNAAWFGTSVGVSGDTVVAGADGEVSNGADNSANYAGAAYIFTGFGPSPAITRSGGDILLSFPGEPGLSYRVQYSTNLAPPQVWHEFTPPAIYSAGPDGTVTHRDVNPPDSQRFYRTVTNP